MASRTKSKEEARARRLAEEQAKADQAQRNRRLQILGGTVIAAIVVVVAAVIVSSGGGNTSHARTINPKATTKQQNAELAHLKKQDGPIFTLLNGIPQHGNTLGSPTARVTVTEYGDLECPICRDFALTSENQLIANDVRTGKAKLVYKSLETATGGAPNPNIFWPQQAAAYAAGLQGHAWDYIELFYHQQGAETTGYANQSYFDTLAKQINGLNFAQWQTDSKSHALISQVHAEQAQATAAGYNSTPTIVISGPKGQAPTITGVPQSYAQLAQEIAAVT